jgi:hypothetical protein
MELNTQRRATGLKEKLPEIRKSLDTVRFMQRRMDARRKKMKKLQQKGKGEGKGCWKGYYIDEKENGGGCRYEKKKGRGRERSTERTC